MNNKLDKLNELAELLKTEVITQTEFNSLKNELLNPQKQSEESPKIEEFTESLQSIKNLTKSKEHLNKQPHVIDKKIINALAEKEDSNFKIKTYLFFGLVFVAFVMFKNCDFGNNNSNTKNESLDRNSNNQEYKDDISQAIHTCRICLKNKKESNMIRSSGDVLSNGKPYWVCNGINDNMRCINQRYRNVKKQNNMLRQESEYRKYSGAPESPFK